jgi:DNA-binding winged helix-turn-helix (wHTH) protein/tetratricopeptide (TPR) repeat protein
VIAFPPFRLDVAEQQLWKGDKLVALRKKPFAILTFLVANPNKLVTHDELLAAVWAGSIVSDSSVRTHLHDLRQALGEGVIETVIGRGYRFIAEITSAAQATRPLPVIAARPEGVVVGRDAELAALRAACARAETGKRQVCIVSGEPGIGKTTLLDAFVDELEDRGVLAVRGHCVEQFGTPEAYLAMIEVIGKLQRSRRGAEIVDAFARYAPTFLAKMPHLVSDAQLEEVTRRAQGGTEARMLRELAEALEASADQEPIAIVLEDLQWSDLAMIDLLSLVAQRTERAKLLVVGTARRAALQTVDHPLSRIVRNLVARFGATAIPLDNIDRDGVRELLSRRFPAHELPPKLAEVLTAITGGTPLFLVTLVDDLVRRGMIADGKLTVSVDEVAAHRPESIKQLIDMQLDRLTDDEQRMLEAASLVGASFDIDTVAAPLGISAELVDERCDNLARRGLFLRRDGERYAVTHALVQEVCEERGSPARRRRCHVAIAEHLERTHTGRTHEIAHLLGAQLEKAGNAARAIDHYVIAGQQTASRFASADAVAFFERARALLPRLPRTRERDLLELQLLATIGQLLIRTPYRGGDPLHVYERALELAREITDVPNTYAALANLCLRRTIHAEMRLARKLVDELDAVEAAHATSLDPALLDYGAMVRGFLAVYRGDLAEAKRRFENLVDVARHAGLSASPSNTPSAIIHPTSMLGPKTQPAVAHAYLAVTCSYLGEHARAVALAKRAIDIARLLDDPIALGITENMLARILFHDGAPVDVTETAARVVVERATAGWVVMDECRLIVRWAASQHTPLTADEAAHYVAHYRTRLARLSLGAPNVAAPIADMLWRSKFPDEAREVVELAIAYAQEHDELMCMPELLARRAKWATSSAPRA